MEKVNISICYLDTNVCRTIMLAQQCRGP